MIIVYSPRGGEVQKFDARLRVSETVRAAQTVDRAWPDIRSSLDVDREAMRVVAWVVQKRDKSGLMYGDFDPFEDELAVRLDRDEIRRFAEVTAGMAWLEADATSESVAARLRGIPPLADDVEHAEQVCAELAAARPKGRPSLGESTTGPSETSGS